MGFKTLEVWGVNKFLNHKKSTMPTLTTIFENGMSMDEITGSDIPIETSCYPQT